MYTHISVLATKNLVLTLLLSICLASASEVSLPVLKLQGEEYKNAILIYASGTRVKLKHDDGTLNIDALSLPLELQEQLGVTKGDVVAAREAENRDEAQRAIIERQRLAAEARKKLSDDSKAKEDREAKAIRLKISQLKAQEQALAEKAQEKWQLTVAKWDKQRKEEMAMLRKHISAYPKGEIGMSNKKRLNQLKMSTPEEYARAMESARTNDMGRKTEQQEMLELKSKISTLQEDLERHIRKIQQELRRL